MGNIDGNLLSSLKGGDLFFIKWNKPQKLTVNIILSVGQQQYLFVDLSKIDYYLDYEVMLEETQSMEEIIDFLSYLSESEDASIQYVGNSKQEKTYRRMIEWHMSQSNIIYKKDKAILMCQTTCQSLMNIKIAYLIILEIQRLPMVSGNLIHKYKEQRLVNVERLRQIREDEYLLLPTSKRFLLNDIDEEKMAKWELEYYLFMLVIQEEMNIKIEFTHDSTIPSRTISLEKMNLEKQGIEWKQLC